MVDDPTPKPRAWVRDDAERIVVEQVLGGLVGRRINAVRYVEVGEEVPHEPYWSGPLFDWVDDAIELDLDDGTTWTIVWEDDATNVDNPGIVAHRGRRDYLQADEWTAVWDVTDHWHANGPRDIAVATPVWSRDEEHAAAGAVWFSDLCLRTLLLNGKDERAAVITLGERLDDGSLGFACCDLAVFFSLAAARAAGVCLDSEPRAV